MAVVGGGGQAELAVLHERAAMPVPDHGSVARPPQAQVPPQPLVGTPPQAVPVQQPPPSTSSTLLGVPIPVKLPTIRSTTFSRLRAIGSALVSHTAHSS